MRCPGCGLYKPETATVCDCGYHFSPDAETAVTNARASQQQSFGSPTIHPVFPQRVITDASGGNSELRVVFMVALICIIVFLAVALVTSPDARRWLGWPEPTLLITTDLDCNWRLDGRPQAPIQAKQSLVVPIAVGQHLIEATTTDGADEFQALVEIHEAHQYVAAITLDPVRQKRSADEREKARLAEEELRRQQQRREREEQAERDR